MPSPAVHTLDDAPNCREACALLRDLRRHGPKIIRDAETQDAAIALFAIGMIEVDPLPDHRVRIRLPRHPAQD